MAKRDEYYLVTTDDIAVGGDIDLIEMPRFYDSLIINTKIVDVAKVKIVKDK